MDKESITEAGLSTSLLKEKSEILGGVVAAMVVMVAVIRVEILQPQVWLSSSPLLPSAVLIFLVLP